MNDLIDTTEMYLRTIFELEEEGIVPMRARIAERLHQSGPTVSQTVARMERDGLLTLEGDRHLRLTDRGRAVATAVMRKHRLAECLLVDVIGLDYADVHEEACRWEHVMSDKVERKLLTLLDNPTVSPFGNPIPGLEALRVDAPAEPSATADRATGVARAGGAAGAARAGGPAGVGGVARAGGAAGAGELSLLAAARAGDAPRVVVRRIGEQLQEPVLLRTLAEHGVRPGAALRAGVAEGAVTLDGWPLPAGVAQHLFVAVDKVETAGAPLAAGA